MEDIEQTDGPRFGEFHAVSELGRGATSTVYLAVKKFERAAAADPALGEGFPDLMPAESTPLPQRVAVKVVNFTDESTKLSRRFRKLFATEAWVASQLDHPNITKVFDWKIEDDRAYLIMEHLEGETLDSFVSLDKLLPVQQVVDIIHKVAVALDYAHRRGVVNRDIKPANVMLCTNGEIKVMDFGLALNIKKNVDIDSTYINGLGSPSYMSPEQIKGYTLNHQTDLYSLGVMFYQLLTGRLPFRAKNTAALIYQIINMSPVPVTQLNPELPAFTDLVIAKAMEKDLYSRYRLGANFAKDLSDAPYQRVKVSQTVNLDVRWKALRAITALGDIDDLDIWELLRASSWRELPPASVIMREGEEGNSFGIVVKGLVELENSDRAFTIAARGDFVGATEWLDKGAPRRMCTATTLDNVVYLEVHPVAFEYATEELAEVVNRLAMESVLKRLRAATRLARTQSPMAIHPAPEPVVVEPAALAGAAPSPTPAPAAAAAPENPLGWGVFAGVDANAAAAQPAPSAAPLRAATVPAAPTAPSVAAAPAAPTLPLAPAPAQPRPTSVVVQPMPASAAAAIAQAALGRAPEPPAAFHLDSSATTDFTDVPLLLPDEDRTLPAPPRGKDDAASNGMLTTEMAPNYSATTAFSTSEMAPNFMSTTALELPSEQLPDAMSADAAPLFDLHEGAATSEMAPNFAGTTAFSVSDYEPPAGTATAEMAPQYSATTAFNAADFAMPPVPSVPSVPSLAPAAAERSPAARPASAAPAARPVPVPPPAAPPKPDHGVLTTDLAPEFDKTSAFDAADFAVPSLPDDDMPAEPLLAPFSLGTAPAHPELVKTAPRKMPEFDPDKTVTLSGGFGASSSDGEGFTESLRPASSAPPPASMFSGAVKMRNLPPEDFDKTVEISGGFEAQPIEEEAPLDDLFPPIKF